MRGVLSEGLERLKTHALKLLGWLVVAYLLLKVLPDLKQALHALERVRWGWLFAALGLEVLSESGFVASWRSIVDPEKLLGRSASGQLVDRHAAWAQLGGGILVPGGSIASIGVGAWILHRFGMPSATIAERQFTLSFLNTTVDALALILLGVGLGLGIFSGEHNLLLTLLPAMIALAGLATAVLVAHRATVLSSRHAHKHPKISASINALAGAVADTERMLFHGDHPIGLLGACAYLGFDSLVLWTAFVTIHAHPLPGFPVVLMAYLIGALGGSIPLPAGLGAVGGIAGMLILYGVGYRAAVAAVLLYEAVALLVPLVGGAVAYLFLRHDLRSVRTDHPDA